MDRVQEKPNKIVLYTIGTIIVAPILVAVIAANIFVINGALSVVSLSLPSWLVVGLVLALVAFRTYHNVKRAKRIDLLESKMIALSMDYAATNKLNARLAALSDNEGGAA